MGKIEADEGSRLPGRFNYAHTKRLSIGSKR